MSRRARPWSKQSEAEKCAAVERLLDAGQAQSIIAYKLGATPSAVTKIAKKLRDAALVAAQALKQNAAAAAANPRPAPANLAVPDGEPGAPTSPDGGAKSGGVEAVSAGQAAQAGGHNVEGERAVPIQVWASRHLAERRDIVQSALEDGQGIGEIAARFGATLDELRELLGEVFRRALDADFPPEPEEAVELPAFVRSRADGGANIVTKHLNIVGAEISNAVAKAGDDASRVAAERAGARAEAPEDAEPVSRGEAERMQEPVADPALALAGVPAHREPNPAGRQPASSSWAALSRDERDAAALVFRRSALSYTQMSERMGVSKSTIVSHFRSMEARGIAVPASTLPPVRPREEGADAPRPLRAKPVRRSANDEPIIVIDKADASKPLPGVEPIELLDLTATTCRWSVGEQTGAAQLFCGADCPIERPFCRHHARLAYNPAPLRAVSAPADPSARRPARPTSPWSN